MVWVVAAGLIVGGAVTAVYLITQEPRGVVEPQPPVVNAVVDAGEVEPVVIVEDVPDAAMPVAIVPLVVDAVRPRW